MTIDFKVVRVPSEEMEAAVTVGHPRNLAERIRSERWKAGIITSAQADSITVGRHPLEFKDIVAIEFSVYWKIVFKTLLPNGDVNYTILRAPLSNIDGYPEDFGAVIRAARNEETNAMDPHIANEARASAARDASESRVNIAAAGGGYATDVDEGYGTDVGRE